jgi:hypothetical protein
VDFGSMKEWILSLPMQLSHFSRAAQVSWHFIYVYIIRQSKYSI